VSRTVAGLVKPYCIMSVHFYVREVLEDVPADDDVIAAMQYWKDKGDAFSFVRVASVGWLQWYPHRLLAFPSLE